MDFTPDPDQQAVLDAVETILARHAGAARLRELGGDEPAYDTDLHRRLADAGYLDVSAGCSSRLDAALVVEAVAHRLGAVAAGHAALLGPSLGVEIDGPLTVVLANATGPARFAADATAAVVLDHDSVRLVRDITSVPRVASRTGWPIGSAAPWTALRDQGVDLAVDPAEVRTWWRIALSCELVGSMRAALQLAVDHVTDRHQFGRPIGSFQAVQHGLARCAVAVEGARWLAYEAAWTGSPVGAATAVSAAMHAAEAVRRDTHQFTGALGFTTEFDLHLSTMRLPALTIEAGLTGSPLVAAAVGRWPAA
ncbi:MAG: acyl-CoA dehydrogenase [Actinobacteria bacterium]|nr:acyl-CoA dehydrogenase [Actinomycetota bacterium]